MKWLFKDRSDVIGIAFIVGCLLAMMGFKAHAGDFGPSDVPHTKPAFEQWHEHEQPPGKVPNVTVEHHRHYELASALVSAAITYWIVSRRAKHRETHIRALCAVQVERQGRIERECIAK